MVYKTSKIAVGNEPTIRFQCLSPGSYQNDKKITTTNSM